jgi:hypothetical protein
MQAEFNTKKGRKKGEVVISNIKTIWVRLKYKININLKDKTKPIFEKREKVIKRHKVKHNVVITGAS